LTSKQQRFCEEFAVDLNVTGAARSAGYSMATAHVHGPLLAHLDLVLELGVSLAKQLGRADRWAMSDDALVACFAGGDGKKAAMLRAILGSDSEYKQ
jgi:hypothetical protein